MSKDSAAQAPTLAASGEDSGFDAIVRYYEDGTDEVRNLLKNECSIIYECSYCRSLFRSIINFIAHKRASCRSLHSTYRAEHLEMIKEQNQRIEEAASTSRRNQKPWTLRRFNPASNISKHIRPVNVRLERAKANIEIKTLPKVARAAAKTTIVDGKQLVEELPIGLAIKDQIPENRVPLVMPRENSRRYGIVQLRRRRSAPFTMKKSGDESHSREFTPEEIAIIERIPSPIPVDFVNLRCEDQRCAKNQSFSHVAALAHHLAIQHQTDYVEASQNKKSALLLNCFLCDATPFRGLKDLQKHFNGCHPTVRAEHIKFRMEQLSADSSRRKEAPVYRARSISLESFKEDDADEGEQKSKEEKQQSKKPSPKQAIVVADEVPKRTVGKVKPLQLPELKFTQEEEQEQQLDAAFALKLWMEEKQRANITDEISSITPVNIEEVEEEIGIDERHKRDPIIDEEELRKIDQLLNSKTPNRVSRENTATEEKNSCSEWSTIEEDVTPSLAMTRAPRPRRPNNRYKDYEDIAAGEQTKKRPVKAIKSLQLPIERESKPADKAEQKAPENKEHAQPQRKRKLPRSNKKGRKRAKKAVESLELDGLDAIVDVTSITKPAAAIADAGPPKIPEIQDFVLPKSWKEVKQEQKEDEDDQSSEHEDEEEDAKTGQKESSNLNSTQNNEEFLMPPIVGGDQIDMPGPSNETRRADPVSTANSSEHEATPPPSVLAKERLPSIVTDRYKEGLLLSDYSPKARKLKESGIVKKSFYSEPSRRKQNLSKLPTEDGDSLSVLGTKTITNTPNKSTTKAKEPGQSDESGHPQPAPKPKDLSLVPVYLTETQRDLFFKPLKLLDKKQPDGLCQCGECGQMLKNTKDGRRHMVAHIRVIRLRCSLCDAGAFFCSDIRIHLMYRHCDKLSLAPDNFVNPGVPCMDKEKADMLTKLVDPYNPGRVMYTVGKIISWTNPVAYLPDPKIERNILGPALPSYVASPNPSPRKMVRSAAILSSPKKIVRQSHQTQKEEEPKGSSDVAKATTSQSGDQETTTNPKEMSPEIDVGSIPLPPPPVGSIPLPPPQMWATPGDDHLYTLEAHNSTSDGK